MIDADAAAARPLHPADGTATEGRKGIAYLRDHYVVASLTDSLEHLSHSGS
jgi:hypothetical protein